jgi:hypothetical protein
LPRGSGQKLTGEPFPKLLDPLSGQSFADPEGGRDLAVGTVLHEALDEQRPGFVRKPIEQRPDLGERLASRQGVVRIADRHRQAPGFRLRVDIDPAVVERRGTPGASKFVDRKVAQDEEIISANLPKRLIVGVDEIENFKRSLGDEFLGPIPVSVAKQDSPCQKSRIG